MMNEIDNEIGKALQDLEAEHARLKESHEGFADFPKTVSFDDAVLFQAVNQYLARRDAELERSQHASIGSFGA